MLVFDKSEIREKLTLENIFELLQLWGGDPEYVSFGIISSTICHNYPGEGSKKLYYYENTGLFKCYTGCDSTFDIFELTSKVAKIQKDFNYDLNDSVRWIARKFNFSGTVANDSDSNQIEDWKYLANYDRIQDIEVKTQEVILKEYDCSILDKFNYNVKISPWLQEGIAQEVLNQAKIGFYPGGDQITIPHFDKNDRFIGLRGRSLCKSECEKFGKYRPLKVNNTLYNHPLGMNLYNLNNSKSAIKTMGKAILFEGEKSSLLYQSYFGMENDISVAACGSSISFYQIHLLLEAGAKEIIIAFDRQFQEIGDEEFKHLKANLLKIHTRYKSYALISFIFDKEKITSYKASPIDEGKEKFLYLVERRILL